MKIRPNTFLIGVQKAATSSLYNWISQHEEICAPESLKDIPFFSDDRLFEKGSELFDDVYPKYFDQQKIIFHGNVNYVYFEKSLERIRDYNPNSKFVLVLRNPIERALSAYFFAIKRGIEHLDIIEAFSNEDKIIANGNFQELSDLTYKDHGLYFNQIETFKKYFNMDQLCVIFFEDLKAEPKKQLKKIFTFLSVNNDFDAKLNYLNDTGQPRNKYINRLIYKESNFKKFMMNKIINKLFSFDTKVKVKLLVGKRMTKNKKKEMKINVPDSLILTLKGYYKNDIEKLENELNRDLSNWK